MIQVHPDAARQNKSKLDAYLVNEAYEIVSKNIDKKEKKIKLQEQKKNDLWDEEEEFSLFLKSSYLCGKELLDEMEKKYLRK